MMKITNANWDRVNLYLTVDKTSINEAYLLDERNNKFILPLKENEITINISNLSKGEMIEDGKYYLFVDGEAVTLETTLLKNVDSLSKVFKYRAEYYALIVELGITEDYNFFISASYMMKNK